MLDDTVDVATVTTVTVTICSPIGGLLVSNLQLSYPCPRTPNPHTPPPPPPGGTGG